MTSTSAFHPAIPPRMAGGLVSAEVDGPAFRTRRVLDEIAVERARQDAKWGQQNHPDGTAGPMRGAEADHARRWTEVAEALAEAEWPKLRAELIQVAAVAVAWIEAGDRREAK